MSQSTGEKFHRGAWSLLWRSQDIRRQLLVTIGLVILYRLLLNVPLPGLVTTPDEVRSNIPPGSGLYTTLDFLSMLSGSSVLSLSVMTLGLLPFNLTYLLLQFIVPFVPSLYRRFQEDPRDARQWLERWNYFLAAPVAVIESLFFLFLVSPNCQGRLIVLETSSAHSDSGILFRITTVVVLVAGSYLAVWIAGLISEYGIRGYGNTILIASGIIGQISAELARLLRIRIETAATVEGLGIILDLPAQVFSLLMEPVIIRRLVVYAALFVLCIIVVIYIQQGRRTVPVEYPTRAAIYHLRRTTGVRTYLPIMLTVSTEGLVGSQLLILLATFYAPMLTCTENARLNAAAQWFISGFGNNGRLYPLVAFFSVVIFTYFYSLVTFEQQDYGASLYRTGGRIPGVIPGEATQRYLTRIVSRITIVPACALGFLAITPSLFNLLMFGLGDSAIQLALLDAEKILIIVGVIRDVFLTFDAELKLRGYQDRLLAF